MVRGLHHCNCWRREGPHVQGPCDHVSMFLSSSPSWPIGPRALLPSLSLLLYLTTIPFPCWMLSMVFGYPGVHMHDLTTIDTRDQHHCPLARYVNVSPSFIIYNQAGVEDKTILPKFVLIERTRNFSKIQRGHAWPSKVDSPLHHWLSELVTISCQSSSAICFKSL